jgi:hypothetical protein
VVEVLVDDLLFELFEGLCLRVTLPLVDEERPSVDVDEDRADAEPDGAGDDETATETDR